MKLKSEAHRRLLKALLAEAQIRGEATARLLVEVADEVDRAEIEDMERMPVSPAKIVALNAAE